MAWSGCRVQTSETQEIPPVPPFSKGGTQPGPCSPKASSCAWSACFVKGDERKKGSPGRFPGPPFDFLRSLFAAFRFCPGLGPVLLAIGQGRRWLERWMISSWVEGLRSTKWAQYPATRTTRLLCSRGCILAASRTLGSSTFTWTCMPPMSK